MHHVLAAVLLAVAAVVAVATLRAWHRDTAWLRARPRGPLDFVPIRTKAKRIHLGLRVAIIAALVLGASVLAALGSWGG
jgi:hypothetical protein